MCRTQQLLNQHYRGTIYVQLSSVWLRAWADLEWVGGGVFWLTWLDYWKYASILPCELKYVSDLPSRKKPARSAHDVNTFLCHKQWTCYEQILHYNTISIILHLKKILCIKEEENLEYLSVIFCQNIRRCISAR